MKFWHFSLFAGALLGALMLVAPGVSAHRANYVLTELTWRVDQRNLEVVHNVHLDDAVVLLAALGDVNALLDESTENALLDYLQSTFVLSLADQAIELNSLGAHIVGDTLWLYQEVQLTEYPQHLQVESSFMFDLFEAQTHQVNLIVGSRVGTLLLDRQVSRGEF